MREKTFRKLNSKAALTAVSLILVLVLGVVGTVAFLMDTTNEVVNKFSIAELPNEVVENFDGAVKNDVAIKNTTQDNKPAYIRTAVIVTWARVKLNTTTGKYEYTDEVHSSVPVEGTDYEMTWYLGEQDDTTTLTYNTPENGMVNLSGGNWYKGTDGFYYFDMPVAAGEATQVLFTKCEQKADANVPAETEEGCKYVLSVTVVGQSVQADGKSDDGAYPVVLAWGEANGGSVTGVNEDRSLTVATNKEGTE